MRSSRSSCCNVTFPAPPSFPSSTCSFGRDDAVSVAREMWQLGHVAHPVEALRYHERFWGWGAAKYPDDLRKIEGRILGGEAEMGELVRAHAMSVAQISAFRPSGSVAAAAASFGGSAGAAAGAEGTSTSASLPPALRPGFPFEADLALQLINGGSKALGAATTVPPAPLVSKLHGGPIAYDGVPSAATAIDISPESDGVLLASAAAIALRRVLPAPIRAAAISSSSAGAATLGTVETETERFLAALGLAAPASAASAAGGSPLGAASAAADPLALRARLHQRMPADQLLDAEGLRRALLHTPSLALDRYAKTLTPEDAQGRYAALLRACEPTWEAQRRAEKAARDAEKRARSQALEDLGSASSFLERRIKSTRDSLNAPPPAPKPASAGGGATKPAATSGTAAKAAAAKPVTAGAAAKSAAGGAGASAAKPTAKAAAKSSAASSSASGGGATPTASSVGQKRKAPDAAANAGAGAGSGAGGSGSAASAPEDVVYYLGKTGAGSASHAGVKALQLHTLPALAKAIACAGIGAIKAIETAYLAAVPEGDKPSLRQLQATINALAEKRKGTGWAVRAPYESLSDMSGDAAAALMEKHPLKVSLKAIVKKPKLDAAAATGLLAGAGSSAGASGSSASNASAHPAASSSAGPSVGGAGSGSAARGAGGSASAAEVISIDDE